THLQAGEFQDIDFDLLANGVQIVQGAAQAEKRFVNGIDLEPGREPGQDRYWYWRISICSLLNRVDCVTAGYTLLGASWAYHCAVPRRRRRCHDAPSIFHGADSDGFVARRIPQHHDAAWISAWLSVLPRLTR